MSFIIKYYNQTGRGKNRGVVLLKCLAAFLITYSHMGLLFPQYDGLVTGGAIGDGLFFFCSGFTLFLGRTDNFFNWYKRRINRIYPTIIMWALFSSFFLGWNWSVEELITTPRYWFIPCIMVYYVIFYIIRTFFMNHLKWVFIFFSIVIALGSIWLLDYTKSVMYADISFMRMYYFLFMLLGAMTAIKKRKERTSLRVGVYVLISVLFYYACMGCYKLNPMLCRYQLISLIPLLSTIYWLFVFCDTVKIASVFDKPQVGKPIYLISTLTLEVYMVQYALFTDKFNGVFPLNIALTYFAIFSMAYLLKCSSNLFSLIFKEERITWDKIYQV